MSGVLQAVFQNQRSFGFPYMDVSTSGATVTTSGNYKVAVFEGSGSITVNRLGLDSSEGSVVDYLVVSGGGGAGATGAGHGGGGAGGMLTATGQAVTVTSYTITVGGGGATWTNGTA